MKSAFSAYSNDQTVVMTNEAPLQAAKTSKQKPKLLSILKSKPSKLILSSVIFLYYLFILIRIAFETDFSNYSNTLNIAEIIILAVISLDIVLNIFALKKRFFYNCSSSIYFIIILLCTILLVVDIINQNGTRYNSLKIYQIFRVIRLLLILLKLLNIRFLDYCFSKKPVANLSSNYDAVLLILQKIIKSDLDFIDDRVKPELTWCYDVIKSKDLYKNLIENKYSTQKDTEFINNVIFEEPVENQSLALNIVESPANKNNLSLILKNAGNWDFNIFQLESAVSSTLEVLGDYFFTVLNLYDKVNVPQDLFLSFLKEIDQGYLKSNSYHNSTHAADVTQAYFHLLTGCKAQEICYFSPLDTFICLLSSIIHDFQHPGVSNAYLINSSDNLALRYNDRSVLENYHVSTSFEIILKHNLFVNVPKDLYKTARAKIINCVLATDPTKHSEDLNKFTSKIKEGLSNDEASKSICMEMMLRCCDISNPSRLWDIAAVWTERVMNEFFNQGDKEKELGLNVSFLCDRYTTDIGRSQISFIEIVTQPSFEALNKILPETQKISEILKDNKAHWKEKVVK